ncbi:O-Antigen ligase [Devosia sp. YR412]|uniref:O-antigen ligase family protein n=1 Tax=Devosia sp. YR412 TaxID=1881030 RepID=UPI0008ACEAE2|nr:O-antigen ligase family protein [Devosia sp. YR412]SEQ31928.1 O-Antigen ligase [Devosia sp. YR412]
MPNTLLLIAVSAIILLPGYPAYIGAYIALLAALLALLRYGLPERQVLRHPSVLAIMVAITLVAIAVPFVYRSAQDVLAPLLILPVLSAIALGMLGRPAGWVPGVTLFAKLCLAGSAIAVIGGLYERYGLGIYRPGLGNNPIHYSSLAALVGCLAMVGVVGSKSPWRYGFLLGPVFALGAATISDSRGPMLGAVAMTGTGMVVLLIWLWRETLFRLAVLTSVAVAAIGLVILVGSGNTRVAGILESGLNIFRFTGGTDDIRAALYSSAMEILKTSPIVGVGLGQIMVTAQTLFPQQGEVFTLENLHADWANFAAMAGGLGLIAWLLLLSAPLLLLIEPNARRDRPVVLGALILFVGQFTLGVSNATFGILPQTTLYAVALGYFLVRARRLQIGLA